MQVSPIFRYLPSELQYEVFEHAAASDTCSALALSLVASWVHRLVEPYLYHTVVLSTARSVLAFLSTLSHKPSSFITDNIKHLGIFAPGPVQSIDQILDACKGVQSLASGFSLVNYKQMHGCSTIQALDTPKEQHFLGLSCRDGWDTALVGPTVTHLRVHYTPSLGTLSPTFPGNNPGLEGSTWNCFMSLPALTHLAIVYRPSLKQPTTSILEPIQKLFATPESTSLPMDTPMPKLQLVLIQVTGPAALQARTIKALNDAATSKAGDVLRVVAERAPLSAVIQWERCVREGRSVWDNAEEVVLTRLAAARRAQ